jgi:hypothetical protein
MFPLYDFKHPRRRFMQNSTRTFFDTGHDSLTGGELVEPDGIEPTTS